MKQRPPFPLLVPKRDPAHQRSNPSIYTNAPVGASGTEWRAYSNWFYRLDIEAIQWSEKMRTFTIELRVDHSDEEKDETIKECVILAAKHVLTQALLIKDKQDPRIAVHSGDFFSNTEVIKLTDDPDTILP